MSWTDRAACVGCDPDWFFPDRTGSTEQAKRICRTCPVREDCLEHALSTGEKYGVWGGLSERERRKIRRRRAIAHRVAS